MTALVPLDEARKELGIGRSSAYILAKTGWLMPTLPVFRIGGTWKVSRAQLERVKAGDIPVEAAS